MMSSCVLSNSQEAGVWGSLGSWEIWQALILCRGRRGIMKERRGEMREVGGHSVFIYVCWLDCGRTQIRRSVAVSQSLPSYLSGADESSSVIEPEFS